MSDNNWRTTRKDSTDWYLDSELNTVWNDSPGVSFSKNPADCADLTFIPLGYYDIENDPSTLISGLPTIVSSWTES